MELKRLEENIAANEEYVKIHYPKETFISNTAQFKPRNKYTKGLIIPENVRVAESRIPFNSEQRRTLRKELRQAGILAGQGNSVFLTPEPGRYKERVTDAVINGIPYELRNVTGTVKKIEKRFGDAKEKGNAVNVFLNLENDACIKEARRRIGLVLGRHPEYTGKIIVSTKEGKVYFGDTGSVRN